MGQAASVTHFVLPQSLHGSKSAPAIGLDAAAQEKRSPRARDNKEDPGASKGLDVSQKGFKDELVVPQAKEATVVDDDDSSVESEQGSNRSFSSLPSRTIRKQSLAEFMSRSQLNIKDEVCIFNPNSDQLTVGDVVRVVMFDPNNPQEGIVVEKVNKFKLKVDFGDCVREVLLEQCAIVIRSDEFEVGDKVEAKPAGSNLFFVGVVIKVYPDKSIDVRMDGDDPDDIEYSIPADNARKLMSRRSVVVNRWKKAFMLVVAVNMFKRIQFRDPTGAK